MPKKITGHLTSVNMTEIKIKKDTVVTYDGSIHPRSKCRRIKDIYYLLGDPSVKDSGQCYLIGDTYYISNGINAKVQWNYSRGGYTIDLKGLVKGYVDKKGTIGYFEPDVSQNLPACNADRQYLTIMNENCIPTNMAYDFADGIIKPISQISMSKPFVVERNKPTYSTLSSEYYGFGEDLNTRNVEKIFKQNLEKIPVSVFDKYFGKYTHGLEIETDGGWLPEYVYYRHGALPLKDGSIYGTEITTFPYVPYKMFNNLKQLANECSKYTIATHNTSLHHNVGNVPNDPYFRVALWMLYCRLQSEIETFIPPYKRDQRFFAEKRGRGKDHCRIQESLGLLRRYHDWKTEIPIADEEIRRFLNEGSVASKFVKRDHNKWDQRTRYYALNLLPMYFPKEGSQPRVEYRIHSGTVNPTKILCWTFLCTAITKFAEEQQERIFVGRDKITLEDVIEFAFADGTPEGVFLTEYLKEYVKYRTKQHIDTLNNDSVYGSEFKDDNSFVFQYKKMSLLNYEQTERTQPRKKDSEKLPGDRF